MNIFIPGDNFDRAGGEAEEVVWEKVKSAFGGRDVLGYSRYPLFQNDGGRRKEPDLILVDTEIGFVVVEVKGYCIDDIVSVENNQWSLKDSSDRKINPIAQVEDYLYSFCGKFDVNRELRNKYKAKSLIALPYITKADFEEKGFLNNINEDDVLFKDSLTKNRILEKMKNGNNLKYSNDYNSNSYKLIQSILGHENNFVEDINESLEEGIKKDIANKIKAELFEIDIQQETIGKSIPPGPQRIRGIAGSGKTLLICQKAAYIHLKNPEYKIVITFFTQSLYDVIIKTLDMYIKSFTNGESGYDKNSNLKVLHAWGSIGINGLYREIAARNNVRPLAVKDVNERLNVKYSSPEVSINYISKCLLEEKNGDLERIFDAIFIDEGQDLVCDDRYKYNEKQPFYYMAYLSIKPNVFEGKQMRRLIWAYDELQSLNDTKIPSAKELFGDSTLVVGSYKGGIKKSEIMQKCYRTPYQILTSAHAIGMGFFRKNGLLSGYTRKEDWENIGYKVSSGNFTKNGNEIILERSIENNPNPINKYFKGDCFEFKKYSNEVVLINELAKLVKQDIHHGKLNPSRDILIISLKQGQNRFEYLEVLGRSLNRLGVDFYSPGCGSINRITEKDWRNKKPDCFWLDGAVTISDIERAKGNEATMVYVVGAEDVAKQEESVSLRNKLFTALTRAKCWVHLMGAGDYEFYEEIEKSIKSNGTFKFIYNRPKKNSDDMEIG